MKKCPFILSAVVVAACVFLAVVPVKADVFAANFEAGYTSGPFPTGLQADGHYPALSNALSGQPGSPPQWAAGYWSWDPTETPDSWTNDAYVIADPANPSNHVAAFIGNSSGGIVHPSGVAALMSLNTTNDVTLSLKACFPSTNGTQDEEANISFLNSGLAFGRYHYYGLSNIGFNFNGVSYDVNADEWHTAALTYHLATSTVDFSLDGVLKDSGVAVDLSTFTGQTKFDAWVDGNYTATDLGVSVLLDDVQVSQVPEPATLSILLVGGIGALLRRRNR